MCTTRNTRTTTPTVTLEQVQQLLGTVTLVEALPEPHYRDLHLPTAINLPPDQVDALAATRLPDRDAAIVVYCTNTGCGHSHDVAGRLVELGYTNVSRYAGGKEEWYAADLPTETGNRTSIPVVPTMASSCSLDAVDLPARLAAWSSTASDARSRTDVEGGVRLEFAPATGLVTRLAQLVEAEQTCCTFFAFDLATEPDGVALTITAPDATTVLELIGG